MPKQIAATLTFFFAMKKGYPACLGKKKGDELLPRIFFGLFIKPWEGSLWNNQDSMESIRPGFCFRGSLQHVARWWVKAELWEKLGLLKRWWFHNFSMVWNFLFTLNCGKTVVKHTHDFRSGWFTTTTSMGNFMVHVKSFRFWCLLVSLFFCWAWSHHP